MSASLPAENETRLQNEIKGKYLVTVALDIGTSFSGYAFLTRNDFKINPLRVFCQHWSVGELGILLKTKTAILLNNDKKYVNFGFEAEKEYIGMTENEKKNHYFFRYFKMKLYGDQSVRKIMKITDEGGKKMYACLVFAESIRYLKDSALKEFTKSGSVFLEKDIKWVVTVPAIWSESAKQFMSLACKKARIDSDDLDITLEPESAAVCCKYMSLERIETGKSCPAITTFADKRKVMILDLGGGTVDITAYQVIQIGEKSTLKEIYKATGGDWGGRTVDKAFEKFWKQCIGKEQWQKLKEKYLDEIVEFFNRFEIQKRSFRVANLENVTKRETIHLSLPECLREIKEIDQLIKTRRFKNVSINRGKISFSSEEFTKFFQKPLSALVNLVQGLCSKPELAEIETVLMVGGFSESPIIQDAVKETITNNSKAVVFIPKESESVILKGAAIYGYVPEIIIERVSRFTYGISTRVPFDEERYSRDSPHYHCVGHDEYVEDIFYAFIRAGDPVIPDQTMVSHTFRATALNKRGSLEIDVFASTERNPVYTKDPNLKESWKIGCVEFPNFNKDNIGKAVTVNMKFGHAKLHVDAQLENGKSANCKLNLLK